MRNSTVPEIANLARKNLIIDDYWNDTSDNIQVLGERDADEIAAIFINGKEQTPKSVKLRFLSAETRNLASPGLTYNRDGVFAPSPIACFTRTDSMEHSDTSDTSEHSQTSDTSEDEDANHEAITTDDLKSNARRQKSPPVILRR